MEKIDVYFARPEDKAAFWKRIAGFGLFVADSLGYGCEISPPEATKGNALAGCADLLDFDVSACLAFGDSLNDLSMLEWAGCGVAVANAVPEVLAAAKFVAPTNDEDGVAVAIERFLS